MNLEAEFDKFLAAEQLQLTPEQLMTARMVIACNNRSVSWMRARRTGVTTLFTALEKFYKTHNPYER